MWFVLSLTFTLWAGNLTCYIALIGLQSNTANADKEVAMAPLLWRLERHRLDRLIVATGGEATDKQGSVIGQRNAVTRSDLSFHRFDKQRPPADNDSFK